MVNVPADGTECALAYYVDDVLKTWDGIVRGATIQRTNNGASRVTVMVELLAGTEQ